MDQKDFLVLVEEIISKYSHDTEKLHALLDEIMEEELISRGYIKSIQLIREQKRWYA